MIPHRILAYSGDSNQQVTVYGAKRQLYSGHYGIKPRPPNTTELTCGPAVNAFLSEGLETATDGKYQRAHVDPSTLRVSLLVPETGQVITDPPVSHGTRTLLYVLMRIGLAQHMSAIGEPVPLVLDDPFVDLDSRRLRRIMEFLLDLSPRMQILLFTKDRETLEWFQERAVGLNHRIHSLSGSLVAGTL